MIKYIFLAAIAAIIAMPDTAAAQAKKGKNGGPVVTSQGHPIEFVRKGMEIVFYVSDDDGSPLSTKEMRAAVPPSKMAARRQRWRSPRRART